MIQSMRHVCTCLFSRPEWLKTLAPDTPKSVSPVHESARSRYITPYGTWFSRLMIASLLSLALNTPAHSESNRLMIIDETENISLSDAFSVYMNHGLPLHLSDILAADRQQQFTPLNENRSTTTNFGLTRAEVWLQLHFYTQFQNPQRRLLEVAHASLDRVDMYLAPRYLASVSPESKSDQFIEQSSGDRVAFTERPVQHRHHVFELLLLPNTEYTLYLRVDSEGTLTVPTTLWQPDALWRADQTAYSVLSLYYGLMLALLVWNLFMFASLRDPLYLIYVGFGLFLALGQAGLSGLSGQFLWPDNPWLNNMTPAAVAAAGVFGAMFVQRFLGAIPRSLGMHWFMPTMSIAYGLTFLCAVFWSYYISSIAVNLTSLVLVVVALGMGAISLYRRQPGARYFVLAWASLLIGVLIIALHNLAILPSNIYTANALLIGSSLEMMLLSLAMADRINELQRARDIAQAETIQLKQQMLESEQQHRQQLADKVAARTQELELANKQLQKSQALLEYQANHDALTGLVNRKFWADRLIHAEARAKRHSSRFALMVVDVDNFKSINDNHGHAAGDTVLVSIANRLLSQIRDSDTIARLGGDEFVLILESVQNRDDVESLRQKLLQCVNQSVSLKTGKAIQIQISIGSALYPDDSDDLDLLFNVADKAMYLEKA